MGRGTPTPAVTPVITPEELARLRAQISNLDSDFSALKKRVKDHLGMDPGTSDYPHPSLRVRSLVFGGGLGRLDQTGISLQSIDNGVEAMAYISRTLERDSSTVTVENTAAETTLESFSLAANTLAAGRGVRLRMLGDGLNNSGGDVVTIWRVKLGTTTLWGDDVTFATSANRAPWSLDLTLAGIAAGSQAVNGVIEAPTRTAGTPSVAGQGIFATAPSATFYGTSAEDETTALTLTVSVDMDTAHADAEWVKRYAVLELI